jgi:hypothetical protein
MKILKTLFNLAAGAAEVGGTIGACLAATPAIGIACGAVAIVGAGLLCRQFAHALVDRVRKRNEPYQFVSEEVEAEWHAGAGTLALAAVASIPIAIATAGASVPATIAFLTGGGAAITELTALVGGGA